MTADLTTFSSHDGVLSHEALLYQGRDELRRAVADFVEAAARAGEPVLAALPRTNLEWLRAALGAEAHGVRFEDMTEIGRNPACLLPVFQDWIDDHDGRARVISEPMWVGRSYAETAECLRHEALMNVALSGSQATILCPYDANLEPDVLLGAEMTHPRVRDANGSRPSDRFEDPLRVSSGEHWPQAPPGGLISELPYPGDLGSLRRAVIAEPVVSALSPERREDVVFVVNEAVTNAVKHGDPHCTTRIWMDGPTVIFEVMSDSSISDVLAGRRRPPVDAHSGRGLWLINQMCDLVELRSDHDRTTVRMHVRDAA